MTRIMVTGANGFIGSAIISALKEEKYYDTIALVRKGSDSIVGVASNVIANINDSFHWPASLHKVDCVIHCAGRAHVTNETAADPLREFRKINLDGTIALAKGAAAAGVRRFIFLSSIGVNGSVTRSIAFNEDSLPAPTAHYAISKFEAEQELLSLQAETSMEIVIIRPPLVYSANAPGNFHLLLRLVSSRVPLPLAGTRNQRSMIALENLVDFIISCVDHPSAANQVFLIADGESLSTQEIVRHLALGMGVSNPLLFPYPDKFLRSAARLVGKQGLYSQLYDSLIVDSSKARRLLSWQPRISAQVGFYQAGRDYKNA